MFLSQEIDIKLCQNYTKTDICQILYKSCSIKHHIQQVRNQSENNDTPEEPEKFKFAPILFEFKI